MRPISTLITEVEREIAMRRDVYPRRVRRLLMRQGEADELIARMEDVLQLLRELQSREGSDD